MKRKVKIGELSKHLFWDVDADKLDFDRNRIFIIQRVLEYGLMSDWQIISNYYGIPDISKTAVSIRDLSKKSVSFISMLSGIPKEKFKCYTSRQLTQEHLNF